MIVARTSTALWPLPALVLLCACGEPELEVRGVLDRVVGQKVQLKLVEGETGFSGEAELVDSEGTSFKAGALKIVAAGEKKLTFSIPPGVAPGKATARVRRKGEDGAYNVPLQINRLALAATSTGVVELIPLAPASLSVSTLAGLDASGGSLALSPGGGDLAVFSQGQINVYGLGKTPKKITGLQLGSGSAMATIPGGVLLCINNVGADDTLVAIKYEPSVSDAKTAFDKGDCQAIAADATGTNAVILHSCDTDSDKVMEDCVTGLTISGGLITQQAAIKVDGVFSAQHVAMTSDGQAVVVADTNALHGIWLSSTHRNTVEKWPTSATVKGISRGTSDLGDLFAAADGIAMTVHFVGFDKKALKQVSTLTLSEEPDAVAFGRGAEIYVAAGTKLYWANTRYQNPTATLLDVSTSNPISALLVQP
jgi:hypothetical protein